MNIEIPISNIYDHKQTSIHLKCPCSTKQPRTTDLSHSSFQTPHLRAQTPIIDRGHPKTPQTSPLHRTFGFRSEPCCISDPIANQKLFANVKSFSSISSLGMSSGNSSSGSGCSGSCSSQQDSVDWYVSSRRPSSTRYLLSRQSSQSCGSFHSIGVNLATIQRVAETRQ